MESCIAVLILRGEFGIVGEENLDDLFVTLVTGHLQGWLLRAFLIHLQCHTEKAITTLCHSNRLCQCHTNTIPLQQVMSMSYQHFTIATGYVNIIPTLYHCNMLCQCQTNTMPWRQVMSMSYQHYTMATGYVKAIATGIIVSTNFFEG